MQIEFLKCCGLLTVFLLLQQALGNHEFDDGVDNLVSFLRQVNFTVVASNLNVSQEPKWPNPPLFVKRKVFDVGGEKIGLVGYTLQKTAE